MAHRKDASRIKQDLITVLGQSKSAEYFMALKSFLLGALDRQRLDSVAREMLGSLHIDLHNELVLTILYNCQPQVRPPPSDSISIALRSAKLSLRPSVDSLFKRKLKRSIGEMNLDYGQRQCLKQSGSLNKQLSNDLWFTEKHRSYTTALNSKFMEILPDSQKNELRRACFLPLPSEQTALPDSNVLRAQMLGIARESRLAGKLSDECVMVLSNALEIRMKNIISECLRSKPCAAGKGLTTTNLHFNSMISKSHLTDLCILLPLF